MAAKGQYLVTDEYHTRWLVRKGDPAYRHVTVLYQHFPLVSLPRNMLIGGSAQSASDYLAPAETRLRQIEKLASLDDTAEVMEAYIFQANYVSCLRSLANNSSTEGQKEEAVV